MGHMGRPRQSVDRESDGIWQVFSSVHGWSASEFLGPGLVSSKQKNRALVSPTGALCRGCTKERHWEVGETVAQEKSYQGLKFACNPVNCYLRQAL